MDEIWAASFVVLWILVILIAFLLAGALRQLGLIAIRLGDEPGALITDAGLDRGAFVPSASGIDCETAEATQLTDLLGPRQRLIIFFTPTCLACRELVPHLNEIITTRSGEYDFVSVCRGDLQSCRSFKRQHRLRGDVLVDTTGEVESSFDVRFTPFAYLIDSSDRVLIRGVVNDWRQLESLLEQEGTPQTRAFEESAKAL